MAKALIKLAFRQVIDSAATGQFEKRVFYDSYVEFRLKIQAYNPGNKFSTFSEVVAHDGRANSLHYKCSFAVLHHIETLKNKIPGLLDTAGRMKIPFELPEFRLLESGITDMNLHKLAIFYITDTLTLLDNFGEYLLLSPSDLSQAVTEEAYDSFTLKMQENLSIVSYRELISEKMIVHPAII